MNSTTQIAREAGRRRRRPSRGRGRWILLGASIGNRGLTLIEVVVATAIFAAVVFTLTGFYLTASSRGAEGRGETTAAFLAQQRMELLRSKAYSSLPGFAVVETVDELGSATPSGRFTRTTVITTPYLGTARLTKVDVRVDWLEFDQPGTITLTSIQVDI